METQNQKDNGMQVTVVNIKYGKVLNSKNKNRPEMTVLDIPSNIVEIKDRKKMEDSIETFVYTTVTKKYGAEVNYCQIFM